MGHNWPLNEMAAVVGKHQLEYLERFIFKRNQIAQWYPEALSNVECGSLFKTPPSIRHSYYKYPVKLEQDLKRGQLGFLLREKYSVETGNVYFPPCHLQHF